MIPTGNQKIRPVPVMIGLMLLLALAAGCATQQHYRYDAIREAHRADVLRRSGSGTPPLQRIPEGPLSLEEAIRIAVANNPDREMAAARIRQSEALLQRAEAAFYPSLAFYTEYLGGNAPSAYLFKKLDQRQFSLSGDLNHPGTWDNFESGLNARWNLFSGGRDLLNREMTAIGREISRIDRETVTNALAASVIQSYYNYLTADAFLSIARQSVANVDNQLRVMQVRYDEGAALKSDLLSLRVRRAEAQEKQARSRNRRELARAALATIMGAGTDTPFVPEEDATTSLELPEHFDAGLAYALANRPEVRSLHEKVRQSRMAVDKARAGYIPSIDAFGKFYYDDENMDYNRDDDNWTAGLLFNWEIFSGFGTRAQENEAQAVFEAMLQQDRKTTLAVELEVKTAYLALEEARARLAVTRSRVANADETLVLVRRQYDSGAATVTRYLEAELARTQAHMSHAAALYDHEKALADIARAIGHLSVAYPETTSQTP
jgi:outer membrane protein